MEESTGYFVSLLQISDTAFPTGAFAHSQGLEAFHAAGELESAEDLARLLRDQLRSLATSDCVALRAAHSDTSDGLWNAIHADRLLTATKLSRETRQASLSTGRRFLSSVAALGVGGRVEELGGLVRSEAADGNLAVCFGVACWELGADVREAISAYLYSTVSSLAGAGQRIVPLGSSAVQRVVYELRGEIHRCADLSAGIEVEEMYSFTPVIEARSMQHERQKVRLYIS